VKAIIIEDEPLVAKDLTNLISQVDRSIEIITILNSLQSAITYFKINPQPDLLFMDIQLNDGVSFDLSKHIDLHCPIIFTTAYNEYALRAFKVNSIDYLLKPIDKEELRRALEKYRKVKMEYGDLKEQMERVFTQLAGPPGNIYKERFMVHSGKSFSIVGIPSVAYFVKDTFIYLVTNDKQQFLTDLQSMEEIEDILNPKLFYRANRQYIISLQAVDSFRSDSYGKLIVQMKSPLNLSIDISREKAQSFKNWIQ
jgi:DNA-binding LytR/AlgR family response regulator